jgi:hypothetical protein
MTTSAASHGIKSIDVWKAARSLGLYASSGAELEALITLHGEGTPFIDQVITETARHVRDLRKGLAAGDAY